ncbi:MAG TPA: glycosyltransferase family 39 protein [Actinomycetota bacterium]|nr:glycosyltransferase family 39 protein [Actinomycetota bacterium]
MSRLRGAAGAERWARPLAERWKTFRDTPRAPLVLLAALSAASLALRSLWIMNPRRLVFDEHYYVNAARRILGVRLSPGTIYANAPAGLDPNFSHPPLGKVLISFGVRTFGDNPLGWRFASLICGTYAVLALYWLARSAGMTPWFSLGASSLMAADPMLFIHGRIGTLEILVLPFMLVGAAVYLHRRPALAGAIIGVGACIKLVCLFVLPCFLALEVFRAVSGRTNGRGSRPAGAVRKSLGRFLGASAMAVVCYLAFLQALDLRYTVFDSSLVHTHAMVTAVSVGRLDDSVVNQIAPQSQGPTHRIATAGAAEKVPPTGPVLDQDGQRLGFAATASPVEWLFNRHPHTFYRSPTFRGEVRSWSQFGRMTSDAAVFRALINPAIIALGIPSLIWCLVRLWRRRDPQALLPAAWFTGVWGSFVLAHIFRGGTAGHLYYMVIVLPAIYLAVAQMFRIPVLRRVLPLYGVLVALFFVWYFPFRTWGGI